MRRLASWLVVGLAAASLAQVPIAQAAAMCFGLAPTQVGTPGPDVLQGTAGPDVLVTQGGNDWVNGLGGNDRICGGSGIDVLSGGSGDDRLAGGAGTDRLIGAGGNDIVDGGLGTDACDGETESDCEGPVEPELSEGNAHKWSTFASDGAPANVSNDQTRVKVGFQSLRFETQSGFDTGLSFPAEGQAHWDLRNKNYLVFWAYAVNPNPNGFQFNQPAIVLRGPEGSIRYEPTTTLMYPDVWHLYRVPLAGDDTWIRTKIGTASLAGLEFHFDTWDYGFTIYLDGVRFART